MLKEITKKEFEEKFPNISTYGVSNNSPVYLDNGVILIDTEWNGEIYIETSTKKEYRPIYNQLGEDDFEIVGYEEV